MRRAAWLAALLFAVSSLLQAQLKHQRAGQRFPASGLVIQVDRTHFAIDVSCQAIAGYMDAMEMRFPVRRLKELDGLQPGMTIGFTLAVQDDVTYVENVHVQLYQSTEQEPMAASQLKLLEKLVTPTGERILALGEPVPDFSLIDQTGQEVRLAKLAGKVVAITFMYTSCPLPNYCFRLCNNFGVVAKRFAGRLASDVVLLSISFDPEHDRPEVLARYASTWKAPAAGWHFLTGATPDVQKVCHMFGMNFWPDDGMMTHSLRTVVVSREGKLAANLEGNEFTAQQLGDLIEATCYRR